MFGMEVFIAIIVICLTLPIGIALSKVFIAGFQGKLYSPAKVARVNEKIDLNNKLYNDIKSEVNTAGIVDKWLLKRKWGKDVINQYR